MIDLKTFGDQYRITLDQSAEIPGQTARKPPRLRRAFPEPKPAWAALMREKNRHAFDEEPRLADLERQLLGLGGHTALLFRPEPHVEENLRRGRYMPAARALYWPGEPSNCHGNAAALYLLSEGEVRIASGYALAYDGLWRQHSWGVRAADGRVIETTVRSLRYFGFVLDDGDESLRFFFGNADHSRIVPEEVARFIQRRMSPELRAEILRPGDSRPQGKPGVP